MTSLGFPGLSSQSVSRFVGPFRPENPETDWDDKPGFPRVVIPIHFAFLSPFSARKARKQTGMTSLGFPVLSSQSVSGFFGPVRPKNTETDWDNKPGLPRVVIPVRFGFCWPFSARKPKTDWNYKPGLPRVVIPIHFWLFMPFSARTTRNGLG